MVAYQLKLTSFIATVLIEVRSQHYLHTHQDHQDVHNHQDVHVYHSSALSIAARAA